MAKSNTSDGNTNDEEIPGTFPATLTAKQYITAGSAACQGFNFYNLMPQIFRT